MSAQQKLTKKQKKGLAFRQRGKQKTAELDAPGGDIPITENLDDDEAHHVSTPDAPASTSKGGVVDKHVDHGTGPSSAKRKRSTEDDVQSDIKPKKQKKPAALEKSEDTDGKKPKPKKSTDSNKQRFILFVGNLKYTTSKEAILNHFAACDPPPDVRLLTPKAPTTAKSKGCAFLEFTHRNALQQGLKLHQSDLEGRKINVELTAGGGGKGENRLEKVKGRNRELATQRIKLEEKARKADGESRPVQQGRPQRHSTTSGVDQLPTNKRTWTVPGEDDDGKTHRGGIKHARDDKKQAKHPKDWGTGVNAIPVG